MLGENQLHASAIRNGGAQRRMRMRTKLKLGEQFLIASMLFGLFFGAGNLIFPLMLGAQAGASLAPALGGMLVTAVGIPLLGILSMGVSRSEGLRHMASRVSRPFSLLFTCALYLTIGPLFAIPRCAATSFTVGVAPLASGGQTLLQVLFTLAFFGAVLFFSLRPSKIMDSVGKWLNPIFLAFLGVMIVAALLHPVQTISSVPVSEKYAQGAFFTGFLQGYDTLDALASLAFGIIVINCIRALNVREGGDIARCTVKSGALSMVLMALIYALITIVGAQSYGLYADHLADANFTGGDAFAIIARHYFGTAGGLLLALTVTFCCLKTAIGLVTSCSETFAEMFPRTLSYRGYALLFSFFSLLVSNIGLSRIIRFSAPVLYFLYPLSIVLILLALVGNLFDHDRRVYGWTMGLTLVAAAFDLMNASGIPALSGAVRWFHGLLPLNALGLGWVLPALIGLAIGLIHRACRREKASAPRM